MLGLSACGAASCRDLCLSAPVQVRSWHRAGLPVCVVRPSLVSALAGQPWPGYVGNLAGAGRGDVGMVHDRHQII